MPEYTRDLDAYGPIGRIKPSETFTRAPDGEGLADPETLGGSSWWVKRLVNHNARTVQDAKTELALVEDALEVEGLVASERVLLSRRQKVLVRRIEGKDARYRAVGARKGRLSPEERARVDQYQALLDLKEAVAGPHPHVI